MSEDVAPYGFDDWLSKLERASRTSPIDWDQIRGVQQMLSVEARTQEQKSAVEALKQAFDRPGIERARTQIERTFLNGKPGADGWPRRF